MKTYIKLAFYLLVTIIFCSCGKEYLNLQQEKNMRVPQTVDDFQKLLDQTLIINEAAPVAFANISADEYWIPASQYYLSTGVVPAASQRNAYIWDDQIYVGRETETDWNKGYNAVYLTNLALEYINNTSREVTDGEKWDRLKGTALFVRAMNFYNLSQVFCPVYSVTNADLPLGLSLREDSDPTVNVPRSTVKQTYQKMVEDLKAAVLVLPDKPSDVFKSSKSGAYALLSRIYMQMDDYEAAEKAADECLKIQNSLLDFNTLTISTGNAVTFGVNGKNNPEVIYMSSPYLTQLFNWFHADTTLLRTYEEGDIRMKAYYSDTTASIQNVVFKGSYKGNSLTSYFCGLATDEVYLNRAESRVRNGNIQGALSDLNTLRKARFSTANYAALQSADRDEVMKWVLAERRRELVMRGTRWADLRRLNKDTKYATTLVRTLNEERFELKPGDLKWVLPLPLEAIQNGGYTQNPR